MPRIRNIVVAVLVVITLAVAGVGSAVAAPPNCSTLEQRIAAHNSEAAQYNSEVAALNAAGGGAAWQVSKYNAWKARLQQQGAALDAEKQQCEATPKRNYAEQANALGYTQRIPPQRAPFDSHGEAVYSNGNRYITPDNTGHNVTGGWKMFDRRGNRIGTYTWDLRTRVGG